MLTNLKKLHKSGFKTGILYLLFGKHCFPFVLNNYIIYKIIVIKLYAFCSVHILNGKIKC